MYLFSRIESWLCHMESLIAVHGSLVLERRLQSTWASVVVAHRLRSTWAQKFWFMGLVAPQHGWSYFPDYGLKLYDLEITSSPNTAILIKQGRLTFFFKIYIFFFFWLSATKVCFIYLFIYYFTILYWFCKRITNPGSMQDTGSLGLVHWDDPEGW